MLLRRHRKRYEQLPDFERGRIIGMMEAVWSARMIFEYNSLMCDMIRKEQEQGKEAFTAVDCIGKQIYQMSHRDPFLTAYDVLRLLL
ncbi:hypothetical protein TNCV_1034591 [Trichonephila clavipes]|nr:hypothetical protein TNCV_1034591 [Trichonephila clavipes]